MGGGQARGQQLRAVVEAALAAALGQPQGVSLQQVPTVSAFVTVSSSFDTIPATAANNGEM